MIINSNYINYNTTVFIFNDIIGIKSEYFPIILDIDTYINE